MEARDRRARWARAIIPAGWRTYEYEVSGQYRTGAWWKGAFDAAHVRAIPKPRPPRRNWYCKKHLRPCEGDGPDCVHTGN